MVTVNTNTAPTTKQMLDTSGSRTSTGIPGIDDAILANQKNIDNANEKVNATTKTVDKTVNSISDTDKANAQKFDQYGNRLNKNGTPLSGTGASNMWNTPSGAQTSATLPTPSTTTTISGVQPRTTTPPPIPDTLPQDITTKGGDDDYIYLTPEQQDILEEWLEQQAQARAEDGGDNVYAPTGQEGKVLDLMKKLESQHIPYVWGGAVPAGTNSMPSGGLDCSGTAQYITRETRGVELPRTSQQQYAATQPIDWSEAKPGDLVFPGGTDQPGHVMIFAGNGQVFEAQQSGTDLKFSPVPAGSVVHRVP